MAIAAVPFVAVPVWTQDVFGMERTKKQLRSSPKMRATQEFDSGEQRQRYAADFHDGLAGDFQGTESECSRALF